MVGTDSNGCKSRDTIQIIKTIDLPVSGIAGQTGICRGTVKTLSANGGYASYLWNDGTTGPTLSITHTGTYWVNISTSNGCRKTDTVTVASEWIPPASFLPADTDFCIYRKLQLKADQPFEQYHWSNGATTAVADITAAGTYTLSVKDQHGCVGSDTIQVFPKACARGIFFPTAFSPNGDAKNDVFRAVVYGEIKRFTLSLYNRFGQLVFTSGNYQRGWDGSVNGKPQDSGPYVWICSWVFADGNAGNEKGTVLLLR